MANLKRTFSELSEDEGSDEQSLKVRRIDINSQVDLLDQYLTKIVEGQEDITTDPEVALQQQQALVTKLNQKLNSLIAVKEQKQRERQRKRQEAENATMNQIEAQEIITENAMLIDNIVSSLATSQARLPRADRIRLNQQIQTLIMDTITTYEVKEQLQNEPSLTPIKQLFDGLIRYYTEMASYGYEHSPEILAKFGSIVAGSAIIGSTIYAPETMSQNSGYLLVYLSSYFRTATATASGLYFLQRGGLPISNILQNVGTKTMQCIKTGCDVVVNESSKILNLGLDALGSYLMKDYQDLSIVFDSDTQSIQAELIQEASPSASMSSNNSSAKEAEEAIDEILDVPIADKIKKLRESLETTMQGLEVRLPPEEINMGSQPSTVSELSTQQEPEELHGGILRKSRRHLKKNRTRKIRNRRIRNKSKRTKKFYKTLKRRKHKSKMRH